MLCFLCLLVYRSESVRQCLKEEKKPLSTWWPPWQPTYVGTSWKWTRHVELQAHFPFKTQKNVQAELRGLYFSGKPQGAMSNCFISLNIQLFMYSIYWIKCLASERLKIWNWFLHRCDSKPLPIQIGHNTLAVTAPTEILSSNWFVHCSSLNVRFLSLEFISLDLCFYETKTILISEGLTDA